MVLKVNQTKGALVADVSPGSPAEAAGIKNGDVIVKVDNQPIENANQLKLRIAATPPGTTVPLEVDRNGERRTVNVTVKERAGENPTGSNNPPPGEKQSAALNGVVVTNLDNQNRAELRIPAGVQGALVTDVD